MSNHSPITPPPELVQQWRRSRPADAAANNAYERHIAHQAARWGADQELEACCEWLHAWTQDKHPGGIENLRAARRPKPPSLKEQAFAALDDAIMRGDCITTSDALPAIRHALDQLDD